ncbi:hypothetical protein AB0C29_35180 [Actinoplanes sp. NPDC048791]|uniref:hypothetical protein n=1 Tax=Actinoplanes sp. NPDC048791 TaxID=3154623 RepID=UPI0033FCD953
MTAAISRATISGVSGRCNAPSLIRKLTLGAGSTAGFPPMPQRPAGTPISRTSTISRAHSP